MTDLAAMFAECRDLLPGPLRRLDEDETDATLAARIVGAMAVVIMIAADRHQALRQFRALAASFTKLADTLEGKPAP